MYYLRDATTNNEYNVDNLIKRFGKDHVKQCVSNGIYKISLPENIKGKLLENKFNKKAINRAAANMRRGHFMENLNKTTGNVKKGTMSFNESIDKSAYRQRFLNRLNLAWLCQVFRRAYLRRLSKIETSVDMITCEPIKSPVIISDDWKNGNKIVYDFDTLIKCAEFIKIPVGFDVNPDGTEFMIYIERPTGYFVSPYTRTKFQAESIKRLYY